MQTLNVSWDFYLVYNHHKGELFLHPSHACQTNHDAPNEIILNSEQMRLWIHKYDYRKFQYFSEQSLKQPFDTMIRLRCEKTNDYIRTQAICQSTSDGFHCVLIDDRRYHELSKKMIEHKVKESNLIWLDEQLSFYESSKSIRNIKQHLTRMIFRETI